MALMKWTYLAFLLAISCEVCFSHRLIISKDTQVPNIGGGFKGIWTWPWRGGKIDLDLGNKENQDLLPLNGKEKQGLLPISIASEPIPRSEAESTLSLNAKVKQDPLPISIAPEPNPRSEAENSNVEEIYGIYEIQEHKINKEEENVEAMPPMFG